MYLSGCSAQTHKQTNKHKHIQPHFAMGFYDCIYDCGDGHYCVSIVSSLDNFQSTSWIYCDKHKHEDRVYDLFPFLRRYSKVAKHIWTRIQIVEQKFNAKGVRLSQVKLLDIPDLDALQLKESKKIFFSEFEDEPAFKQENNQITIIDNMDGYNSHIPVNSPEYTGREVVFNWHTNKVEKYIPEITCQNTDCH